MAIQGVGGVGCRAILRRVGFSATAAELLEPAGESGVGRGFDVQEFEAHADSGFDDAHHGEGFHGLALARKDDASARSHSERLASTDEAASERNVRGDAFGARAGLKIEDFGIGGEGITNSIATVAQANFVRRAIAGSVVHDN